MAFAVRGRALWLPPLLLFASVLLIGSLAFAIANLDRGQEALPPPFPTPGGGDTPVPSSEAGPQFLLPWRILLAAIFILGVFSGGGRPLSKQKTVSVLGPPRTPFRAGGIGGPRYFC